MGYFGGESIDDFKAANTDLINNILNEKLMANFFVPTLADPSQAPEGYHTAFFWLDVPPEIKSWKHGPLNGFESWDDIKEKLADDLIDEFEKFAPGFKQSILDRFVCTPLDHYRNNPSAILGNIIGGSMTPDQFYLNRPVPGVLQPESGSRTFIKNLYLSNSVGGGGMFLTWGGDT